MFRFMFAVPDWSNLPFRTAGQGLFQRFSRGEFFTLSGMSERNRMEQNRTEMTSRCSALEVVF